MYTQIDRTQFEMAISIQQTASEIRDDSKVRMKGFWLMTETDRLNRERLWNVYVPPRRLTTILYLKSRAWSVKCARTERVSRYWRTLPNGLTIAHWPARMSSGWPDKLARAKPRLRIPLPNDSMRIMATSTLSWEATFSARDNSKKRNPRPVSFPPSPTN